MRTCSSLCVVLALLAACATPDKHHSFAVTNQMDVALPSGSKQVRIWFPIPMDDSAQIISDLKIEAPAGYRRTSDADGNKYVYVELRQPQQQNVIIRTTFKVKRREVRANLDANQTRPLTAAERAEMARYLRASTNIEVDDASRRRAAQILGDEDNPIKASRKLYDWVLNNIDYWVRDPANLKASGVGSSSYCLATKTGNCTDFHSLYTSLSRSAGIPTRMKYGSFFKGPLDGLDRDQSYHCWPEFWAPDIGWIPLDVAVADLYLPDVRISDANQEKVSLTLANGYDGPDAHLVDYYFGNLEARRVTWHVGRDLNLVPPQDGGPVNAIPKGYVEVDGKASSDWKRKLTYKQID